VIPTTISITASNTNPTAGQTVTFTVTFKSGTTPLSGKPKLNRADPSGHWDVVNTTTTDTNGAYTFTRNESTSGTYTFQAFFAGDTYAPSDASVLLTVGTLPTTAMTITTSNTTPTPNQPFTLSGTLKSGTAPLANKPVHLERRTGTTGTWANVAATFKLTNSIGKVVVSQKIATAGIYQYRWHYNGTATYQQAYSAAVTETVKKPTSITISTSTTAPKLNVGFTVSGTLKSGTSGLKGLSVHLERKIDSGSWTTVAGTTKNTGTGGVVSASQKVTTHHTYSYRWHFTGTPTYTPRYSPVKTLLT